MRSKGAVIVVRWLEDVNQIWLLMKVWQRQPQHSRDIRVQCWPMASAQFFPGPIVASLNSSSISAAGATAIMP